MSQNSSTVESNGFEVTLGPDVGKMLFKDAQELADWLTRETQFWNFLQSERSHSNEAGTIWTPIETCHREINQALSQLRAVENEASQTEKRLAQPSVNEAQRAQHLQQLTSGRNNARQQLKGVFQRHYETIRLIPSASPRAKFLAELASKTDARTALFAYGCLARMRTNYSFPEALQGAFQAFLFERGITDNVPPERQSLAQLRQEWQATFQQDHDALAAEAKRQTALNEQTAAQLAAQDKGFAEHLQKEKNDWAALHKAYDTTLALEKPVSYWQTKAGSHRRLAWVFGPLALIAAGGVGTLLYTLIQITLRMPTGVKDPATWHPEYWRIGVLLAAGVFGVWLVRIFVLLFLSHIHLLADANERVTMANTYLALLRSDGGLQQKDRDLILQALFRQAATGVVKDDGVPLSWVESLTKMGTK